MDAGLVNAHERIQIVETQGHGIAPQTAETGNSAGAAEMINRVDFDYAVEYATVHLGPKLLYAMAGLTVIFIGYLVAKYVSRLISHPVCSRVDETLGKFVGRMAFYGILLSVGAAVLSELGAPLGGLAAVLAAAGFAIGLAFQGTLSNFAAGVLMLVFRPFKVGDAIHVAGVVGKVNEIDLFTTTLDTFDNRRIVIPNSSISSGTIENISYHPHRRVEVVVGVDYRADMDETRRALQSAADALGDRTIPGEGRGSAIVLAGLGDHAVQWKVRVWVASADYWAAFESLTYEVKKALDVVNISIPYPQLDVHLGWDESDQVQALGELGEPGNSVVARRPRIRPVRRQPGPERSVPRVRA